MGSALFMPKWKMFMDVSIFFKGVAVGLIVAMPVGPVAALCIQRTLNQGRIQGIISGLGAATADALLAFITAFGLTFVSNFLTKEQVSLRLVGGVLLCYLGTRIILSKPMQQVASGVSRDHITNFASMFLLTLANPGTFLTLAAVFAGFGLVRPDSGYIWPSLLVGGVFTGSQLSWLVLCGTAKKVVGMFSPSKLTWLNKAGGIIIIAFGLFILLSLITL
jgi:threonine/homoserine/homoserine lactone efflux protein